jgi:hypothetical protein
MNFEIKVIASIQKQHGEGARNLANLSMFVGAETQILASLLPFKDYL